MWFCRSKRFDLLMDYARLTAEHDKLTNLNRLMDNCPDLSVPDILVIGQRQRLYLLSLCVCSIHARGGGIIQIKSLRYLCKLTGLLHRTKFVGNQGPFHVSYMHGTIYFVIRTMDELCFMFNHCRSYQKWDSRSVLNEAQSSRLQTITDIVRKLCRFLRYSELPNCSDTVSVCLIILDATARFRNNGHCLDEAKRLGNDELLNMVLNSSLDNDLCREKKIERKFVDISFGESESLERPIEDLAIECINLIDLLIPCEIQTSEEKLTKQHYVVLDIIANCLYLLRGCLFKYDGIRIRRDSQLQCSAKSTLARIRSVRLQKSLYKSTLSVVSSTANDRVSQYVNLQSIIDSKIIEIEYALNNDIMNKGIAFRCLIIFALISRSENVFQLITQSFDNSFLMGSADWCQLKDGELPCFECLIDDQIIFRSPGACPHQKRREQNTSSFIRSRLLYIKTVMKILLDLCRKSGNIRQSVIRFLFDMLTSESGVVTAVDIFMKNNDQQSQNFHFVRDIRSVIADCLCRIAQNDSPADEVQTPAKSIETMFSLAVRNGDLKDLPVGQFRNLLFSCLSVGLCLVEPDVYFVGMCDLLSIVEEAVDCRIRKELSYELTSEMLIQVRQRTLATTRTQSKRSAVPTVVGDIYTIVYKVSGKIYEHYCNLGKYENCIILVDFLCVIAESMKKYTIWHNEVLGNILMITLRIFLITAGMFICNQNTKIIVDLLNLINEIIRLVTKTLGHRKFEFNGHRKLFRDVWIYNSLFLNADTIFDTTTLNTYTLYHLKHLAKVSPVIFNNQHLRELSLYSIFGIGHYSPNDLLKIKTVLIRCLAMNSEKSILDKLDYTCQAYLLAIYTLESNRISNAEALNGCPYVPNTFERIFEYLEEPFVQQEKRGFWICVKRITEICFENFIKRIKTEAKNHDRECCLLRMAFVLLHKSCHAYLQLSELAIELLSQLLSREKFPVIILNYEFMQAFMDFIQLLMISVRVDSKSKEIDHLRESVISNFRNAIATPTDTQLNEIAAIVTLAKDHFNARSIQLFKLTSLWRKAVTEAINYAPMMAQSHIQHYMFRTSIEKQMTIGYNYLDNQEALKLAVSILTANNEKTKTNVLNADTFSPFYSSLLYKSYRIGYIYGSGTTRVGEIFEKTIAQIHVLVPNPTQLMMLVNCCFLEDSGNEIGSHECMASFHQKPLSSGESSPNSKFVLLQISALLAHHTCKEINRERHLIHIVAWLPVFLFTDDVVLAAVESWTWILSARSDLSLLLFQEISDAWKHTISARKGIFCGELTNHNVFDQQIRSDPCQTPDSKRSNSRLRKLIEPHLIWLQFIDEQVKLCCRRNSEAFELFSNTLQQSLNVYTSANGQQDLMDSAPMMTNHNAGIEVFFRLLLVSMRCVRHRASIAAAAHSPNYSNGLNERVILTILRYFSGPPQTPLGNFTDIYQVLEVISYLFDLIKNDRIESSNCGATPNAPLFIHQRGSKDEVYDDDFSVSNVSFHNFADIRTNNLAKGFIRHFVRSFISIEEGKCFFAPKTDHMLYADAKLDRRFLILKLLLLLEAFFENRRVDAYEFENGNRFLNRWDHVFLKKVAQRCYSLTTETRSLRSQLNQPISFSETHLNDPINSRTLSFRNLKDVAYKFKLSLGQKYSEGLTQHYRPVEHYNNQLSRSSSSIITPPTDIKEELNMVKVNKLTSHEPINKKIALLEMRKTLTLTLLAMEVKRLKIHLNPPFTESTEGSSPFSKYVQLVEAWPMLTNRSSNSTSTKTTNQQKVKTTVGIDWISLIDGIWSTDPLLCVWLYSRISSNSIRAKLEQLTLSYPSYYLLDCTYAFQFILSKQNLSMPCAPPTYYKASYSSIVQIITPTIESGLTSNSVKDCWYGCNHGCSDCSSSSVSHQKRRFYSLVMLWSPVNPVDALSSLFHSGGCEWINNTFSTNRNKQSNSSKIYSSTGASSSPITTNRTIHLLQVHHNPSPESQSKPTTLNPLMMQFAYRCLKNFEVDILLTYIPQLVQASRYDVFGYVEILINRLARKSNLLAHQLLWNLETNCFLNEEVPDSRMQPKLVRLIGNIRKLFDINSAVFYDRQTNFINSIVSVSRVLKRFPKGSERLEACLENIRNVTVPKDGCCYLPCTPSAVVISVDYESAILFVFFSRGFESPF